MSLKYRYQDFTIGEHAIRLKLLRDLDQFDDPNNSAKEMGISREAWPLFGMVWASSEALAEKLLEENIRGKRILEVGCGMALVSHLLNARGADITAMDIHPLVGDFLRDNSTLNKTRDIPFHNLSWSEEDANLGKFDLIVGSDILYEPRHVKQLAGFMDRHTHPLAEVIVVDPDRGQGGLFHDGMIQKDFVCEGFRCDTSDHLGLPFTGRGYRYSRPG